MSARGRLLSGSSIGSTAQRSVRQITVSYEQFLYPQPVPWRLQLSLAVSLLAPTVAASQQVPLSQPLPPSPSIRKSVNLIEVPVVVRDEKGRPVLNLKADDFKIYDDGKPQTISRFRFVSPSLESSYQQGNRLPAATIDDHVELKAAGTEHRSVLIVIPQLQFTSRYYALRALEKAFERMLWAALPWQLWTRHRATFRSRAIVTPSSKRLKG